MRKKLNKSGKRRNAKGQSRGNRKKDNSNGGKNEKERKKETKEKKEKKEKKKMREQKKLLRSISMSSLPSRDTMNQLSCVDRAIRDGLRDCVENVLKNGNISLSED